MNRKIYKSQITEVSPVINLYHGDYSSMPSQSRQLQCVKYVQS